MRCYSDLFYMGIAHHLTTVGGFSGVATSCWVKNLHFSFAVSIKCTNEFE